MRPYVRLAMNADQSEGGAMLVIRPEQPEDERAVVVAHIAAWRAAHAGVLSTDVLAEAAQPTESYVEDWAQRRRRMITSLNLESTTLVAEVDGMVVGHVTYGRNKTQPGTGQVCSCYVDPDHWGTGVADALLNAALDALPHTQVQLRVHPDNHRARRFYHRHGFRPDGPRPPNVDGTSEIRYALNRDSPGPRPVRGGDAHHG